jgi:hypothetical protein
MLKLMTAAAAAACVNLCLLLLAVELARSQADGQPRITQADAKGRVGTELAV